jgi:predicted double-glycine peptidase
MNEKQAGGDILGRLAGIASRPFVGAVKSQAVNDKVVSGVTNYVTRPLESGLRRSGIHKAISKVYEHGTRPIPGTPKLVQPIMPHSEQRRAYGQWRADDIVHTISNNPELLAASAIPVPGTTEAILGGKHVLRKVLGVRPQPVPMVKKLASYVPSFADELEKVANGDMLQYFLDHPEKLKEKQKRDRRKKELTKTAAVDPYQQETQWSCSAACLKAVLTHWGTNLSEQQAIEAVGAREGRGAECDQIATAARNLGFAAFEYSFDSIDQAKVLLDQDIPIICDIQSFNHPGKGHYVVMVAADDQRVELMDPNTPGNWRVISRAEMDQRWWDRAMAPPHDLMPKHGIVIIPSEDSGEPL